MANPNPSYIDISEDEELQPDQEDAELPINDDDRDVVFDDEVEEVDEFEAEEVDEFEVEEVEEFEEEVEEFEEEDENEDENEDEEDENEDEQDENEDENEDEEDLIDPDYAVYLAELLASSFSHNAAAGNAGEAETRDGAEEGGEKRRRIGGSGTASFGGIGSSSRGEGSQGRSEIEGGLVCPICLDAWTNEGTHCICCLPCGHVFGMSCITQWLLRRNSGKCPQCNQRCKLKDVRKLFIPQVASVDEESQKRIRGLEEKCASLENQVAGYREEEAELLKREAELQLKVQQLTEAQMLAKDNGYHAGLGKEHLEGTPVDDIPVPNPHIGPHIMTSPLGLNSAQQVPELGSRSVCDLEASSSQPSASIVQELEMGLVAERVSARKAEADAEVRQALATATAEVEQRLESLQQSLMQSWDEAMQQIHSFIPGFVVSRNPFGPRETTPNQHAGEDEDHTTLG